MTIKVQQPKPVKLGQEDLDAQLREIREAIRQISVFLQDFEDRIYALEHP